MKLLSNLRFLKIALFVSLALNLLVFGAVAGFVGSDRHKDPRIGNPSQTVDQAGLRSGGPRGPLGDVLSGFERSDRRAFGRALRQVLQNSAISRTDKTTQFQALQTVLATDPFDTAGFVALMDQQHETMLNATTLSRDALAEYLAGLSLQDRVEIANRMKQLRRGGQGWGGRGRGGRE